METGRGSKVNKLEFHIVRFGKSEYDITCMRRKCNIIVMKTKDSFKKIIVVKDDIKLKRDDSGITTMGIFDFLLNENSLDM